MASNGGPPVASQQDAVRIGARYELYRRLTWAVYILVAAVPIHEMVPIANAFAGRQTNVTVTVTASIALSATLAVGNALQWWRGRGQRRELQRLRDRVSTLEGELNAVKGKKP